MERSTKQYNLQRLGFPIFSTQEEKERHISLMIEAGAIPLEKLKKGREYWGISRYFPRAQ